MKKRSSRMAQWQSNDTAAQEATPEDLRISIDEAFRQFLFSDEVEYTFPSNLNNLQRKYIHEKAETLNFKSKSHGREPNRKLTIYKKKGMINNDTCNLQLSEDSSSALGQLVDTCKLQDLQKAYKEKIATEKVFGRIFTSPATHVPPANVPKDIEQFKRSLPITHMRDKIIDCIYRNQVTIISSETGSGKTTQIPQFIMEEYRKNQKICRVICTQPRRISTVAVAERVSRERGDYVGNSVGYHIRLESRLSVKTNLIYCTNGVLIRSLMADGALSNITHVIIDEVHERDRLSDFLLICLKNAIEEYSHLRLILMSATVNIEKFSSYFSNAEVLQVPGRTHKITEYFLDEILQVTEYMSPKMQTIYAGSRDPEVEEVNKNRKLAEMDTALNDCLRHNTQQAWGQLLVYILTENLPVNYQHSQTGLTALMVAAINNNTEHIIMLQGCNADLNIRCFRDRTALDWAKIHGNQEAVSQLTHQYIAQIPQEKLVECYIKSVTDDLLDYELINHVIVHIHRTREAGAILVFLAGYDDIMILTEYINDTLKEHQHTYQIFHLHGGMNINDQHSVFTNLPNKRKIILSTNIAETSITINDVRFVVDSGKAKEKTFDAYTGLCALQLKWISKACVKQRAGRAGRTCDGFCYHIFSRQRFHHFQEERTPEILRVPLEALCLNTKVISPDIPLAQFFSLAPDPPSAHLVGAAIQSLIALGAMDESENLTALGEYLGQLTIDPQYGKMLIYSVIFRCVDPVLTLVSIMTQKDPFQLPAQGRYKADATARRKSLNQGVPSDHIIFLQAFQLWQEFVDRQAEMDFLREYFISKSTMDYALMIRSFLLGQLRAAGFVVPRGNHSIQEVNANSGNWALVKAVIASGLYPKVAYYKRNTLQTRYEKSVSFSTQSCLHNMEPNPSLWYVFEELIKVRSTAAIRGVTAVTPITVALLCGNKSEAERTGEITIDDVLKFDTGNHDLLFLRKCLETVINKVLASSENSLSLQDSNVINTVATILLSEDKAAHLFQPENVGKRPKFLERNSSRYHSKRHARHSSRSLLGEPPIGVFNINDHLNFANDRVNFISERTNFNKDRSVNGHHFNNFRSSNHFNRSRSFKTPPNGISINSNVSCPIGSSSSLCEATVYDSRYDDVQGQNHVTELSSYESHDVAGFSSSADCVFPNFSDGTVLNHICATHPCSKCNVSSLDVFKPEVLPDLFNFDEPTSSRLQNGFRSDNREILDTEVSKETVYILVKPKQVESISIAYESSKWIFSPQTQVKILTAVNEQKKVRLVYVIRELIYGIAEFICMTARNDKPEALIKWIIKPEVALDLLGYNKESDLLVFEGPDGQEIDTLIGDDLCNKYMKFLSLCAALGSVQLQ